MNKNKLKVIFITMDEPYYVPKYISDILLKLGKEVEVAKVYALPPNVSNKNFLQTVKAYFSYFGIIVFSYMVMLRAFYLMSDFLNHYFKTRSR